MLEVDLGCGSAKKEGTIGVDKYPCDGVDIIADFEAEALPFENSSVGRIYASHVMEHVHDLFYVMSEVHRVLAPEGEIVIRVPYWSSEGAFRDPTHVRYFSEKSFDYFDPECMCAYYADSAPFKKRSVKLRCHPSPAIRFVEKVLGMRALKAFNNTIVEVEFILTPVK